MWKVFLLSLKATLKVLLICAGGAYLNKAGILDDKGRKAMSEAVVQLLLPCLIFTRVMATMSVQMLPTFAILALANVAYVSIGCLVGTLMVHLTKPARGLRSILAIAPGIGHANAIPFMLVGLICAGHDGFSTGDVQKADGYLGLYLVMHSFTLWGVGMNRIAGRQDHAGPLARSATTTASSRPPNAEATVVGAPTADGGSGSDGDSAQAELPEAVPPTSDEVWADSVVSVDAGLPPPATTRCPAECTTVLGDVLRRMVPKWLNRPMVAALAGCIMGLTSGVRDLLVEPEGALHFVYNAMEKMGEAAPLVAMLAVGALFVNEGIPRPSAIGYGPLAGVVLAGRLLILPAICVPVWGVLHRHVPSLLGDRVLVLTLCLECCTPTAYNLVMICILQGRGSQELSAALFYQSLAAVFSITVWVTVILTFVIPPQ